jgi:hypothetical protein
MVGWTTVMMGVFFVVFPVVDARSTPAVFSLVDAVVTSVVSPNHVGLPTSSTLFSVDTFWGGVQQVPTPMLEYIIFLDRREYTEKSSVPIRPHPKVDHPHHEWLEPPQISVQYRIVWILLRYYPYRLAYRPRQIQ